MMLRTDFDPSGPPLFKIHSNEWWVKILGMQQHNWALIETHNKKITIYFFHDQGIQKACSHEYKFYQLKNRSAVVDSLEFECIQSAELGLQKNGFMKLEDNPGPWIQCCPTGNYFDARNNEERIYSKLGYWID